MNTGLDPELLTIAGGQLVPASTFLPPPTEAPHGGLCHLSYDNAAVEMRPAHTDSHPRLVGRLSVLLRKTLVEMAEARRKLRLPRGAKLSLSPAARLSDSDREHPSVQEFGCSPSLSLDADYRTRSVVPFCGASDTRLRSAGFHIHQEVANSEGIQAMVAVLDCLLGLTDVIANYRLGFSTAMEARRATLGYGRAGEHRIRHTSDGTTVLEYRTLSPWPLMSPTTTLWALSVMKQVTSLETEVLMDLLNSLPKRAVVMQAINQSDVTLASAWRLRSFETWSRAVDRWQETSAIHRISEGRYTIDYTGWFTRF